MTTPTYSEALNTVMNALETAQKTIIALASELEEARAIHTVIVVDEEMISDLQAGHRIELTAATLIPAAAPPVGHIEQAAAQHGEDKNVKELLANLDAYNRAFKRR